MGDDQCTVHMSAERNKCQLFALAWKRILFPGVIMDNEKSGSQSEACMDMDVRLRTGVDESNARRAGKMGALRTSNEVMAFFPWVHERLRLCFSSRKN